MALSVVQAGMQMASARAQAQAQRQQGEAQKNYYNYLAAQNDQQAIIAERTGKAQSRAIQDVQKFQGRRLALSNAEFRASQEAALAASGVPLSSVTAGDISRNTASKQALDEALLRHNADVQSFQSIVGSQNRAFSLRSQAGSFRVAGENSAFAGRLSARNTLLAGGARAPGS